MAQGDDFNPGRIGILIEYDNRVVRDGIALLLSQTPGFEVLEYPSQETDDKEKRLGGVDVVLAISESDGRHQIQKIKDKYPDAKVIIMGMLGTEKESLEYIEAGASGYIQPDGSLDHLIETVGKVHQGEASCPPDILARLFERIAALSSQMQIVQINELSSLTQRELQILRLIADGCSNKEIAADLRLELQTVKNHVHNILEKLQVHNRHEAVSYTRKHHLFVGKS